MKLVLKLGAHGDEVGLSRTYSGFCASVVWHGTFKVRWATHSESTASVSLIPAILQERVELATTFLELQGVDSKGSVEFLTYSTVVLAVLRATGVELLDTGASNLGVNSAAVPQPKLQLFDLGSWYLVHPPKVPSMRWTGFRALLDKYAPARSGWIRQAWLVKEAWVPPASWYRRSFRSAKATVRCSSSRASFCLMAPWTLPLAEPLHSDPVSSAGAAIPHV